MSSFDRVGLVVHPSRALSGALATVRAWAERQDAAVVQVPSAGQGQRVAPPGEVQACDLVIALGGDGTTLAALNAAAPLGRPVLGVACGSLGALTAVTAERLSEALDRVAAGDWIERRLPAVTLEGDGGARHAVNDVVLVRAGAGQVIVEIELEGERFVRFAGDGLVCATPLGSSAYTLAAGGPLLSPGAEAIALTPLAPHGGVAPPLVVAAGERVAILFDSGNGGARLELDGQVAEVLAPHRRMPVRLGLRPDFATLVSLGEHESELAGLRRRRILLDSPRVLARDDREAAAQDAAARDVHATSTQAASTAVMAADAGDGTATRSDDSASAKSKSSA
jgi:NAD+ kinase